MKEKIDKIKNFLIEKFNPLAIILFGSYSRGTETPESDIDIAIIAEKTDKKTMFKTKLELEELVLQDIDLINLINPDTSETLKYEILMNGEILYCLNDYEFEKYKLPMLREYLDFNESRKEIIDRIKNGGTIYGK